MSNPVASKKINLNANAASPYIRNAFIIALLVLLSLGVYMWMSSSMNQPAKSSPFAHQQIANTMQQNVDAQYQQARQALDNNQIVQAATLLRTMPDYPPAKATLKRLEMNYADL